MPIPVQITLIICGTVVVVTAMGLIFAAWIIREGVGMEERRDKSRS